jgi:hypothetical protein
LFLQEGQSESPPLSNIFTERAENIRPRGMIEFTIDYSL